MLGSRGGFSASMGSELSVGMSRGGGGVVRARTGNTVAVWAAEGALWIALLVARPCRREQGPKSALIASALLPSCSGVVPPEMFTLKRCAFGSFAAMLQNGSVMMPGVISPTPSSSKSTRPSPRSRTKHSYRLRPSRRALQKRVVAYPRYELPAAVRASGDVLAADLKPRHAARQARAA